MRWISVERDPADGRILWIRLDGGSGGLRVLRLEMLNELYEALRQADRDDGVHAVIVSGVGDNLCAGADLRELTGLRDFGEAVRWFEAFWRVVELIRETGKPVIAAVRGYAVAGCNELAMACDLVVAGRSARFGQPEAAVGSTAAGLGVQLLPLMVGEKRARELLFTGRLLTAEEAMQMGLVNRVVDDEKVEEEARRLALEIIEGKSPQAFRVMKSLLNQWTALAMLSRSLARDVTAMVWLSEEFRERARDFLQKRKMRPRKFTGVTP